MVSLFTKVTRPPIAITTSLGVTPFEVIVTTLVAGGGGGDTGAGAGVGGTVVGVGEGADGEPVDPQAAAVAIAITMTTRETTFARGNRPAAGHALRSTRANGFAS